MSKKMLIDARHREETRVAVLSNGKVEDFDFETESRKPLRGNIYLARITRVEPSLQAAFVEYGGNRHGFLAFSEIHPDYYQIPMADREILRQAEALEAELAAKLIDLDKGNVTDVDDEDSQYKSTRARRTNNDDEQPETEALAEGEEKEDRPKNRRGGRRRRGRRGGRNDVAKDTDEAVATATEETDSSAEVAAESGAENTSAEDAVTSAEDTISQESNVAEASSDAIESVAENTEASSNDGDDDNSDDDPQTIGLEDPTEPRITQDLDDVDPEAAEAEPTLANEDGISEDGASDDASDTVHEQIAAEADTAPVDTDTAEASEIAAEDAPVSDEAPDDIEAQNSEETEAEALSDADATEEEAPVEAPVEAREKTEEELEAERVSKQEAAEIADLERRYDEARRERDKLLRNYRIQEVVKRRQIMLVQVVKEERGNKGAALTAYMSLAGRYSVLMPNNARGGGVSRKITNAGDRKRLRSAIRDLEVPKGQGLIIRTAGAKRTKAEINRDYDYLARLWGTIRDQTMKSVAPCLIYEEASLIKRAIRDLYDKDTGEIQVEGEEGYREAKDFMKMLMPSHAKFVQPFRDTQPLFLKHDVERQLDEMYQPVVTLKSGGYLVIQQTEALISVDVNSGKATKERNVEATALKTNSEAAVELARQCRLRDLAGLIVVDFIDMDENRNNRSVEKKLKDAMKMDRARIQIGHISGFGLMEMSRQRRRSGIVDGTTRVCPTCDGAGAVRSVEMAALRMLRTIEETASKDRPETVTLTTSHDVALYILNHKRAWVIDLETRYGVRVEILSDQNKAGDQFDIAKAGKASDRIEVEQSTAVQPTDINPDEKDSDKTAATDTTETTDVVKVVSDAEVDADDGTEKKKRRRRGGRRKKSDDTEGNATSEASIDTAEAGNAKPDATPTEGDAEVGSAETVNAEGAEAVADDEDQPKKRRRRGRRGGSRTRKDAEGASGKSADASSDTSASSETSTPKADTDTQTAAAPSTPAEAVVEISAAPAPTKHKVAAAKTVAPEEVSAEQPAALARKQSKRGGWWQRALGRD